MNLGKVKTFLIVLFLGINLYLAFSAYSSSRFFVDGKTLDATVKILSDSNITVKPDAVPKYTVNLVNIDTENIIYSESFKKLHSKEIKIDGNVFSCAVKSKNIHKAGDAVLKKEVKEYLAENGFETRNMKFRKDGKNLVIYCSIKGYDIFDSLITAEVKKDKFILTGSWFEPLTKKVFSRSRDRNTVYITSVLMDMAQNEKIQKNAPFEITKIKYGYLAGKPYDGSHVTAALPYYQIYDNKGNIYYYDARNGTELGGQ